MVALVGDQLGRGLGGVALAGAVEPDQLLGGRGFDAALLGQSRQHLSIALAGVAPDDRPLGGFGLHGQANDADPVAPDQAMTDQTLQDPDENLGVDLQRQPAARPAQPRMVRHRFPAAEEQELPQRQAVGAAPLDAALTVDPFEVADQRHAEIPTRRQTPPAPLLLRLKLRNAPGRQTIGRYSSANSPVRLEKLGSGVIPEKILNRARY